MTNLTKSFSVVRFGKQALLLSSFLAFAACGGNDYNNTEKLPDEATDEQQVVNTVDAPSTETPATEDTTQTTGDDTTQGTVEVTASTRASILKLYDYVDPNHVVNQTALGDALVYFYNNKSKFKNKNYVSVIDFTKRSTLARFHIIDMNSGSVWSIHVAHGKGSDPDHDGYAQTFSNKSGSNASSLGYYKTAETYSGSHGLSLRLDGLSTTNSNARSRAVVIHGASYVQEKSVVQGRSWGCPAVSMSLRDKVVNALKNGSLIYAYAK